MDQLLDLLMGLLTFALRGFSIFPYPEEARGLIIGRANRPENLTIITLSGKECMLTIGGTMWASLQGLR